MSDARAAMRPGPGAPRSYAFPRAAEHRTANGLRILALSMPGRPLAALQLLFHGGAAAESPAESGLTALLAKLLTEGGDRHDADGLVEAAELLGASIGAEAGWERVAIGAEVPVARIAPLLDLVAEGDHVGEGLAVLAAQFAQELPALADGSEARRVVVNRLREPTEVCSEIAYLGDRPPEPRKRVGKRRPCPER